MPSRRARIAVVVPCYRVKRQIESVLRGIGPEVHRIFIVDDACPESTGDFVASRVADSRVRVIKHAENLGVGGATLTGYRAALEEQCEIIVKLDGDGQMDPSLIPHLVAPVLAGLADYSKGNRFFSLENLSSMPRVRLFGNAALSFVNKACSGYWDLMDPTNGFTAIHASLLRILPLEKIEKRYFFESDMLFRLGTVRAVVREVPMKAVYGGEQSNLKSSQALLEFPRKHSVRFLKRIFYSYFLRDFNIGSIELLGGLLFATWGVAFGGATWVKVFQTGVVASTGTVMLAALPFIVGTQLLLEAISFDVRNTPSRPLHRLLSVPWREDRGSETLGESDESE